MRAVCFCKHPVGYASLQRLIALGAPIRLVVVQASERGKDWFTNNERFCKDHRIRLLETERLSRDESCIQEIERLGPAYGFTIMFTQVIPRRVIEACSMGIVNFHPSLLPRYRGPHPVNWAIIRGETRSGVTAHLVVPELDAGPIICQDRFAIDAADTNISLQVKIDRIVLEQVERVYRLFQRGELASLPQDETKASYFPARTPDDGEISWSALTALQIRNLVRALQSPLDGAFTSYRGQRLYVRWCELQQPDGLVIHTERPGEILEIDDTGISVSTIDGRLLLTSVEDAGQRAIGKDAWKARFRLGEVFGS